MDYQKKKELIDGLRAEMNVPPSLVREKRRFDPATGTIFCNGDREYDIKAIEAATEFMAKKRDEYQTARSDGYAKVYDIAATVMEIYIKQIKDKENGLKN